jgi:hypothetical protein
MRDNDMASEWVSPAPRCYETHKALKIGDWKVYGGSASDPVVHDADIYVSLQRGSTSGRISDPWDKRQVVEIQYGLVDGSAPDGERKVARFKKMIEWLCNQLQQGRKIHVGCIGGHGRTGMVLAAMVAHATGEKDAITYVRDHYCKKAVESTEQVRFLHEHYGVKKVDGSHFTRSVGSGFQSYKGGATSYDYTGSQKSFGFAARSDAWKDKLVEYPVVERAKGEKPAPRESVAEVVTETLHPVNQARSIWRRKK